MLELLTPVSQAPLVPMQGAISALWQRNQPQMLARLALLDRAAAGTLTPALRAEAIAIAHNLSGSLGMFGFHEGTRLARELELHLESPQPYAEVLAELSRQLRLSLFPA